jgi:predicted Rossmann-fold nucleotide-binding protein
MLTKVISGGQTGADQAGLRAAKAQGIETGGFIPLGCLTELGQQPELKEQFGLVEMETNKYPPRTYANVKSSDATIRFAANFGTAGEKCTLKAIKQYDKPHLSINRGYPPPVETVLVWLKTHNVSVLNIAGNRERTCPGIGDFVESYLARLFCLTNPRPEQYTEPQGEQHA